jgi:hypothetical protein
MDCRRKLKRGAQRLNSLRNEGANAVVTDGDQGTIDPQFLYHSAEAGLIADHRIAQNVARDSIYQSDNAIRTLPFDYINDGFCMSARTNDDDVFHAGLLYLSVNVSEAGKPSDNVQPMRRAPVCIRM